MLKKSEIENILSAALSTGGDFSEIFFENTTENKIVYTQKITDSIINSRSIGAGIRVIKNLKSVYASTNDISYESLLNLAKTVSLSVGEIKDFNTVYLNKQNVINISPVLIKPLDFLISKKIDILKNIHDVGLNFDTKVKIITASMSDITSNILIANSNGLYKEDNRIKTRIYVNCTASDGIINQSITEAPGASCGMEFYDSFNIENFSTNIAKTAVLMLKSKPCPAGKMPVSIENGFGGVIFHEACGHSLEGEQVAQGNSEFTDKLNQQIANEKVTAIDDGTIPNAWGSTNIDDEGKKSQKNILIKNGILKSFMLDSLNAKKLNLMDTGNGRRQSYKFAPTSRMTNTFIAPGEDKKDDIIKSIDYGIYAKKMGGGQVNPITGEFNFSVALGYLIVKGEIQHPVFGASLIGRGSQILKNIDMVSDNLSLAQGVCGSSSGNIPTNVGQPLIRVKEITVGGTK
ncbi:MAG: TldD/PmbA family protein [Oscillospiraceae bacterium]